MRDLWFIRHAESLANVGGATTTPKEIPLTEVGRGQADRLAETFPVRPDLIVVSPFDRARDTAEPLTLRFDGVPAITADIHEFTYLSIKRCRDTTSAQRKPWTEEYWNRSDPEYCDGEQAESFAQFLYRLEVFMRDLSSREFALAAIVTHEQVIKAIMWMQIGFAPDAGGKSMADFHKFMNSFKIPNIATVRCLLDDSGDVYFGRITNCEATRNNA